MTSPAGPEPAAVAGTPARGQRHGDPRGTTALLRRAAATVDRLWNDSRDAPDAELWARLGEASRDIHRALSALDPPRAS